MDENMVCKIEQIERERVIAKYLSRSLDTEAVEEFEAWLSVEFVTPQDGVQRGTGFFRRASLAQTRTQMRPLPQRVVAQA